MKKYSEIAEKLKITKDMNLDMTTEDVLVITREAAYTYDLNMLFYELVNLRKKYNYNDIEFSADTRENRVDTIRKYFSLYNANNDFILDKDTVYKHSFIISIYDDNDSSVISKNIVDKIIKNIEKQKGKKSNIKTFIIHSDDYNIYNTYIYIWASIKDRIIKIYNSKLDYNKLKNNKIFI